MNNIGITEGMGKKIVEALKKQTELSISTPNETQNTNINIPVDNSISNEIEYVEPQLLPDEPVIETQSMIENTYSTPQENFIPNANSFNKPVQNVMPEPQIHQTQQFTQQTMTFSGINSANNADIEFEMPTNVAVLKQLISQLPTGVTKQTGAQIIKQTMEALGISMKSVLQEAQQVQEGLNNSSRECQSNIAEYKRQIATLEKQSQQYQKQYAILNDIISLFIQTNNY